MPTHRSSAARPRLSVLARPALLVLRLVVALGPLLATAHNEARRAHGGSRAIEVGTTELIWSTQLADLARTSSQRMARLGRLDHDPAIREALCCGSRFSNSIGMSSSSTGLTAAEVRRSTTWLIDLWLGSAGHRGNLPDPVVTHLGIGGHLGSDGRLWATAVFDHRAASTASTATGTAADDPWCPVDALPRRFADVVNDHRPATDCLAALDIGRGVTADRFNPTGTVARGQLAMQLEGARRSVDGEVQVGPRGRFHDVLTSRRFARAIDAGANVGLLAGGDDGRFAPDAPLRRDQAASIIARLFELELR